MTPHCQEYTVTPLCALHTHNQTHKLLLYNNSSSHTVQYRRLALHVRPTRRISPPRRCSSHNNALVFRRIIKYSSPFPAWCNLQFFFFFKWSSFPGNFYCPCFHTTGAASTHSILTTRHVFSYRSHFIEIGETQKITKGQTLTALKIHKDLLFT